MDGRLLTGADGVTRCGWCGTDPDYVAYHDHEWGHALGNARVAIALRDEFGSLGAYVERYRSTRRGGLGPHDEMPTRSPESEALSADLRRRGFRFVGPTTMYAFCQSSGLVDDHLIGCETRPV